MTVRKKAPRLWAIIGVCSLGLYLAACDNGELPADGNGTAEVELRFAASISDSPSTRVQQPPQPTITQGTAFSDGTHTFGMFVTREDGSALVAGSNDNMKSTLTKSGSSQTWSHADKNGSNPISLVANNGEKINIAGYYPWTANATATSVPFDLSSTNPQDWTDLLYLSSPNTSQQITDGGNPIALKFSHAFCWVTIDLFKLSSNNEVYVTAVSIGNAYAGQGIMINKGSIDPKTGDVIQNTRVSGAMKIIPGSSIALDTDGAQGATAAAFNFLVPNIMDANIKNSDIVIEVTTLEGGMEKVLTFPLSRTHLNEANGLYGFEKGKHNTYHIVYNNSAMNLSLSDWHTTTIEDDKLGEGTVNATTKDVNYIDLFALGGDGTVTNQLKSTDHRYHTYLGEVAENNNGEYRNFEVSCGSKGYEHWKQALLAEPYFSPLTAAKNLAAGGAQIPWKDEKTGTLLAKQACAEFWDKGYTDWRLPRITEYYMLDYPGVMLEGKEYWSATEASATECWAIVKTDCGYGPRKFSKQESFYVRCVRDSNKPKPTI